MTMNFVEQFARELKRAKPEPERLALAIAGLTDPALDTAVYLAQLDEMAETLRQTLFNNAPGHARALHFLHMINDHFGFTGNRDNYYEPNNSFLNVVLERRTGLPIMLS